MKTRRAFLTAVGAASVSLAACVAENGSNERSDSPPGTSLNPNSPGNVSQAADTPETLTEDPDTPDRIRSEWPMPAADVGRSNSVPGAAGPLTAIAEVWSVSMDTTLSAPVLADETLYVGGSDGEVRAVDARTGETRWTASVGTAADTPWVLDDTVYVPGPASIHTLTAADGTSGWTVDAPGRTGVLVTPAGVYYVTDAGDSDDATLVSLDPGEGTEQWRTRLEDPWSKPLFSTGRYVCVPSGTHDRIPWLFGSDTGEFVGDRTPESGADFAAEQIALDGHVYAGDGFFGSVRADRVTDDGSELVWNSGVDAYNGFELAGDADNIYFQAAAGTRPGLYALSRADGSTAWVNESVAESRGRPVVADEAVVIVAPDDIRCFDPADGRERWRNSHDGTVRDVILADDLVFTTGDGTLRALRAT